MSKKKLQLQLRLLPKKSAIHPLMVSKRKQTLLNDKKLKKKATHKPTPNPRLMTMYTQPTNTKRLQRQRL